VFITEHTEKHKRQYTKQTYIHIHIHTQTIQTCIHYLFMTNTLTSPRHTPILSRRPGRIDRKIEFPNPNEGARADILKIHSRKMNLMRGIDLTKIAEKLPGASGAEIKAVCTEAGMYALRERRVHVTQEDFEMAVGKVMAKDNEKNMSLKKLFK
jgi:SpoVK/Ycf46/Vps4 family AAA+-type ATPase